MAHLKYPLQFWASADSKTAGVAILCRRGIGQGEPRALCRPDGRFIRAVVRIGNRKLTLCNVYAPNQVQDLYLRTLLQDHVPQGDASVILGGVFNLVWDPSLDRSETSLNGFGAMSSALRTQIAELGLVDACCYYSPEIRDYSYYSHVHRSYSRIDYFFTSHALLRKTLAVTMSDISLSDHAHLELALQDPSSRTTLSPKWCFPPHILRDPDNVESIQSAIDSYFTDNDLPETPFLVVWDAFKATIRGHITSIAMTREARNLV